MMKHIMHGTVAVLILQSAAVLASAQSGSDGTSFNKDGAIHLFSSSHQDIAWMDTPQACMLFRVNQCIRPAIQLMAQDRNYAFVMENMLNLAEYLEQRPQDRATVERLTRERRLEWGATYNQPYEDLLSGEELVRETYFGRRWLKRIFPGTDARVAFNPDVPGRTLQMPQILAKAGIPYLLISRYHEGLYRWFSPDGSSVLMYTPGHYTVPKRLLNLPVPEAVQALTKRLAEQGTYYEKFNISPVFPLLHTEDFSEPKDFGPLLAAWNSSASTARRPLLRYSSVGEFFEQIDRPEAKFQPLIGERPNLWLYIGGPTHHWAISAKRDAARLLPAAETFATVRSLLDGDFRAYPAQRLSDAWKEEIYPDHGWGGNNGHITDIVFKEKAEFAGAEAQSVLSEALRGISSRIGTKPGKSIPIVLFNELAWKRSDPVVVDTKSLPAGPWRLADAAGNETPCQRTALETPDEINVAAASQNARATADSSASPESGPERAIDGRWSHLETERWVSAGQSSAPHWLTIDFGQSRTIHKVVLRHEGSLGKFQDIEEFNTADFQVQWANSAQGPWRDLVAPVHGNTDVLTTHRFAPKTFRYLRIYITKPALKAGEPARLFEVEAFAALQPKADKLVCMATAVPPVGYKTFYAVPGKALQQKAVADKPVLEDDHYRIVLARGGVSSIYDKDFGKELLETGKFLGGEVFTMQSVGNGAGEFTAIQQPTMEGFDKMSNHKPSWRQIEDGPVRTVVMFTSDWQTVTIRERLILYHLAKRIDFDVALLNWNGARYREFRIAWPVKGVKSQVAYEVPMGVVEVGKSELQTTGGLAYDAVNYAGFIPEIRPREMRDFVNVSDGDLGLTLSSSVAVFDYQDPTANPVSYPVIQPILLASRKSCHGLGNWYLQPGDHYYRFSLSSQRSGWRNGYQPAFQANHPLFTVVGPQAASSAALPEEKSFFSLSADNLVLSTIKKSEDDESVVMRFYDLQGRDEKAVIHSFVPVRQAERTNLIEEEGKPLSVEGGSIVLNVGHHAIETVKFAPAKQ